MKIQQISFRRSASTFIHFNTIKNLLPDEEFEANTKNFFDVKKSDAVAARSVSFHGNPPTKIPIYNDVHYIILLRHPIHAICSAYEMDLKRRRHQKRQFDTNFGTFFDAHLEEWKAVVDRWIIYSPPDIKKIIISFDDIVKNSTDVFSNLSNFLNTKVTQLYRNTDKYISCQKLRVFKKIKFDLYDDILIKYRNLLGFDKWTEHY